jgi:hypothetical protein
LIFRRALDDLNVEVISRPASADPFRADGWWRDWSQLRNGILEWQKLLFYSLTYRPARSTSTSDIERNPPLAIRPQFDCDQKKKMTPAALCAPTVSKVLLIDKRVFVRV